MSEPANEPPSEGEPASGGEAGEEEQPVVYAVRQMARADREIYGITADLKDAAGEDVAAAWYLGIREAIASLSRNPRRFAVQGAESRRLNVEVRRMLYRRPGSSSSAAGHHLYYTVENGEDGPLVLVFHVRHASRRPITPAEGRAIREEM